MTQLLLGSKAVATQSRFDVRFRAAALQHPAGRRRPAKGRVFESKDRSKIFQEALDPSPAVFLNSLSNSGARLNLTLIGGTLMHEVKHATLLYMPDTFVIRHRNIAVRGMPERKYRELSLNVALQCLTTHKDVCLSCCRFRGQQVKLA
ncbi:hypothetical protein [Pseudorhodobacter sp. E13]|uniref:hypothetical protein n=1 Tax=Pseudorhodobacter sp. E13 TaxID=2487931 RepID=UPI000F8E1693|nr:hypothetical protein [Pseudorhodobacter sp. E13]